MDRTQNPLIVGRIPFLVCAPFFHADLDHPPTGIKFIDGAPAQQNDRLQKGFIHLAPSSSIAYARNPEQYWIFPDLCTGSTLEIRSVKLFSHLSWEELSGRHVHLTSQSATSVQLLRLLLEQKKGIHPIWETGIWQSEICSARLLIGDLALEEELHGEWEFRYDLASLWQDWYGLPFVFGMWIMHQQAVEQKSKILKTYCSRLVENVQEFRKDPASSLQRWLQQYPTSLRITELLDYYRIIDYRFSKEHRQSLALFYKECLNAGWLKKMPPLRFWGE
ncbi:MAG TPA: menaquinone biosynthesis protein [Fibrobacteraceae bacterium]|nr:menaquinone biosynthesis protein [Fibrobacteraceae bacterium]